MTEKYHQNFEPAMYVVERNGRKKDRFDVNQGVVGDCWFLAALANLAEDNDAFYRVVPDNQSFSSESYCGMFRFRFFRFGQWVEVVIDDKLPTIYGELFCLKGENEVMRMNYGKKDKDDVQIEFWSPLLEKAYAKLYGSYKAIEGGLTIEAAVDFTGGIPEIIRTSTLRNDGDIERLFYDLRKAYNNYAFIGASLEVSITYTSNK